MVSEINKLAAGGAGVAAMRSNTPAPDFSIKPNQAVQVPEVPKVQAPKPVAIHFDPIEVRQNLKEAVRFGLALVASECGRYIAKAVNLASPGVVKSDEILQHGRVNDRKQAPKIATSKPPRGFGKVGFGSAHDFG